MHVLDIEHADGHRTRYVLRRRFRVEHPFSTPEHVTREFELLRFLEAAGIAAPRPLLLDAAGKFFGVPSMVLSYLPGRPVYMPRNLRGWVQELARAAIQVHAVTPDRYDLPHLDVNLRDGMRAEIERRREQVAQTGESLAEEVRARLAADLDQIEWIAPSLVHDDYWPGNTVWLHGRLAGIIDWTHAELGDARTDVCQCRLDLLVSLGSEAADAFLDAYQELAPRRLPDIWYFDLFRGLRALLFYESWLKGYHDSGLTQLNSEICGGRIRTFLRKVLDER